MVTALGRWSFFYRGDSFREMEVFTVVTALGRWRFLPGDSFREMEVFTASRYTSAPVLSSSRADPSV